MVDGNAWRCRHYPGATVPDGERGRQTFVKLACDSVRDLVVMSRRGAGPEWWAMRLDPATAKWIEAEKP